MMSRAKENPCRVECRAKDGLINDQPLEQDSIEPFLIAETLTEEELIRE